MLNSNSINEELDRAVYRGDLGKVRALIYEGGNVNLKIGQDKGTFLHKTQSLEFAKELLSRGAKVDARNAYNDTPLHYAITLEKDLEFVKLLLKHRADVNAINVKHNTPLNLAVKRTCDNLEVIKALLEYGADINIRNREHRRNLDYSATSFANAVDKPARAKLLIKMTLLKHFDGNFTPLFKLDPDTAFSSELAQYLEDFICEIVRMKTDKVYDNITMHEFASIKVANIKTLLASNKITDQAIFNEYPIYRDVISAKVNLCVEREGLLNKLSESQVYTGSDVSNQDVKERKVILNFDCTYNIAKYLSNDDLQHLITVFYKHADQSLDCSENLAVSRRLRPRRPVASANRCAKCARVGK